MASFAICKGLTMRTILVYMKDGKYIVEFRFNDTIQWVVTSYIIVSHEIMVDWIEKGIHPNWQYT